MELEEEDLFPQLVDVVVGVLERVIEACGERAPFLDVVHERFTSAVALLTPDLRRVRAAVKLEVQLTIPAGRIGVLGTAALEKCRGARELDLRRTLEVRGPAARRELLARGAATAIAPAGRAQRDVASALVLVILLDVREFFAGELAVVGVGGREVRVLGRAVDALPPERVVREHGELVPADLLGEEVRIARGGANLRERARISEGIGQPGFCGFEPKLAKEKALALNELPGHCLGAGHVRVGLDPHATHGNETAARDVRLDAFEQFGVEVADPLVLLRR